MPAGHTRKKNRKKSNNEAAYAFMDVLIGIILLGVIMASITPFFSIVFYWLPEQWSRHNENRAMELLLRDLRQITDKMHLPYWSSGNSIRQEEDAIHLTGVAGNTVIARDGEYWRISSINITRRYRAGKQIQIKLAYSEKKHPTALMVTIDESEYRIPFSFRILESFSP